jgi:hypothetical protein
VSEQTYLDGKLDEITRAKHAGDLDEAVRQLSHVWAEAGPDTASRLTRRLIEPDPPRKRPQLWLIAVISAAVGAAITIAVTIPVTRLSVIAAPTVTATVSVSPSLPPPAVVSSGPVSSFAPPVGTGSAVAAPPPTGADPDVYSSGSLTASTTDSWGTVVRDEGLWSNGPYPDLYVKNAILSAGSGASIFRMDKQAPKYDECRAMGVGAPTPLSQLPSGTFLCIKTRENRVGYVMLDYTANRDGKIEKVLLTGLVWRPT